MRAEKAIELFTYYFQTAFEAAQLSWGCDNDTEIEIAVQNIVEAVAPEPDTAKQNTVTMPTAVYSRLLEGRDIYKGLAKGRIRAEPDAATEQLLQRYRDAASLRVDEMLALQKERDDLREKLNETKNACEYLQEQKDEYRHSLKMGEVALERVVKERDELQEEITRWSKWHSEAQSNANKFENEGDELRILFTDTLREKWDWVEITAESVRLNFAVDEWANRVVSALKLEPDK